MDDKQKKAIETVKTYIASPPSYVIKHRNSKRKTEQICSCCSYPLAERHHLLPFRKYGESAVTISLCPNCHTLYHQYEKNPLSSFQIAQLKIEYQGEDRGIYAEFLANQIWLATLYNEIEQIEMIMQPTLQDLFG